MKAFYFLIFGFLVHRGNGSLSSALYECYQNTYSLQQENLLPHDMYTLIEILRKVENSELFSMDLRSMSVALLHRFRQDGIERTIKTPVPNVQIPYSTKVFTYYRYKLLQWIVPGNAEKFPNSSISQLERCSLHSMISSTIYNDERGDEAETCRSAQKYRNKRSVEGFGEEVEMLTKEQMKDLKMSSEKYDPSSMYSDPPRYQQAQSHENGIPSKCPVEKGVLLTKWGSVSGGALIAGVAAALEKQHIQLGVLMKLKDDIIFNVTNYPGDAIVEQKWIATLAGDLAEVILRQGFTKTTFDMGTMGHWNSSELPRWYFITNNKDYELTAAEIKGDIDGFIIANMVNEWYGRFSNLKMSQILDMYYSDRGVLNSSIRACNRRSLYNSFVSTEIMKKQVIVATNILGSKSNLALATPTQQNINEWSNQMVEQFIRTLPSILNQDETCEQANRENSKNFHHGFVDLKIYIDLNWNFNELMKYLVEILKGVEVGIYNSNFTLINACDGSIIVNRTNSILDLYALNSSTYEQLQHRGFKLSTVFYNITNLQRAKLNEERKSGKGGQQSDVTVIMPSVTNYNMNEDDDYISSQLYRMQREVPDAAILILTTGSTETWSRAVFNPRHVLNIQQSYSSSSLQRVVSRIKEMPKRLINTKCGAYYNSEGSSRDFTDYIEPGGINFYRMHPNYFVSDARVKIRSNGNQRLTVCTSNEPIHINSTMGNSCDNFTSDYVKVLSCGDATLIKDCRPFFMSIKAEPTQNSELRCPDTKYCRYPDMVEYTISYENLVCRSGANSIFTSFAILFLNLIIYYLSFS